MEIIHAVCFSWTSWGSPSSQFLIKLTSQQCFVLSLLDTRKYFSCTVCWSYGIICRIIYYTNCVSLLKCRLSKLTRPRSGASPPPWAHYRGKAATNKLFPRHSLPSPPPPIKPWMAAKFRLVTRHLLINSCLCFWKGSKCHDSKQLRILFSCLGKLCSNKCQKLWN